MQHNVHDSQQCKISSRIAINSELIENSEYIKKLFPWYYMHSDVYNSSKTFDHTIVCYLLRKHLFKIMTSILLLFNKF